MCLYAPLSTRKSLLFMWYIAHNYWGYHILFIWIILLSSKYFSCWFIVFNSVSMMSFLVGPFVGGAFVLGTISGVVSLLITCVTYNTRYISYLFPLYFVLRVLPFVVMMVLLLSMIYSGVNCESFIFSCSHLIFSCYDSSFFLCAFFPKYVESDHLLSGTYSLNEWIPWSWETI